MHSGKEASLAAGNPSNRGRSPIIATPVASAGKLCGLGRLGSAEMPLAHISRNRVPLVAARQAMPAGHGPHAFYKTVPHCSESRQVGKKCGPEHALGVFGQRAAFLPSVPAGSLDLIAARSPPAVHLDEALSLAVVRLIPQGSQQKPVFHLGSVDRCHGWLVRERRLPGRPVEAPPRAV
jgi:hypothetical protein